MAFNATLPSNIKLMQILTNVFASGKFSESLDRTFKMSTKHVYCFLAYLDNNFCCLIEMSWYNFLYSY